MLNSTCASEKRDNESTDLHVPQFQVSLLEKWNTKKIFATIDIKFEAVLNVLLLKFLLIRVSKPAITCHYHATMILLFPKGVTIFPPFRIQNLAYKNNFCMSVVPAHACSLLILGNVKTSAVLTHSYFAGNRKRLWKSSVFPLKSLVHLFLLYPTSMPPFILPHPLFLFSLSGTPGSSA